MCSFFIILVTQSGMYILQLLDWYSASNSVILICLLETIMVAWLYGINEFVDDIYFMIGRKPGKLWVYCWKYMTPSIILFIFFTTIIFNRTVRYNNVIYPSWAVALGWLSFALSLIFIPLHMLKKVFLSSGKANDNFYNALKADFWLPEEEEERSAYEDFKRYRKINAELKSLRK
ncbi:sodium- and chloride-dependent glycine transporter 2-like [Glossina fuscipes]|uniref:Sodium- and chloride-dependent glycine transporter 2-like n=1 Tax=Glossina fuscipes TaxID=7396 RepID=A0A8U0WAW7_9MUSC|nr:sodium- and chloride-dependent glycine transporter 2-like [Glossina fuscipes]